MAKIEILEWSEGKPGGYSINGVEFRGEAAEALVQEAEEMAFATRRDAVEVLAQIIPEDHMASAPDKLAHDALAVIFGSQLPEGASSFSTWEGIEGYKTSFLIGATGKFVDIAMTPEQVDAVRATGLLGTYGVQIDHNALSYRLHHELVSPCIQSINGRRAATLTKGQAVLLDRTALSRAQWKRRERRITPFHENFSAANQH